MDDYSEHKELGKKGFLSCTGAVRGQSDHDYSPKLKNTASEILQKQ